MNYNHAPSSAQTFRQVVVPGVGPTLLPTSGLPGAHSHPQAFLPQNSQLLLQPPLYPQQGYQPFIQPYYPQNPQFTPIGALAGPGAAASNPAPLRPLPPHVPAPPRPQLATSHGFSLSSGLRHTNLPQAYQRGPEVGLKPPHLQNQTISSHHASFRGANVLHGAQVNPTNHPGPQVGISPAVSASLHPQESAEALSLEMPRTKAAGRKQNHQSPGKRQNKPSPKSQQRKSGSSPKSNPAASPRIPHHRHEAAMASPSGNDDDSPTLLHEEIQQLIKHLEPTQQEQRNRLAALDVVRAAVQREYPMAAVELFGSQLSGTAIHSSDMDVAVLNLTAPPPGGQGYPKHERPLVANMLRKILAAMRRDGAISGKPMVIATARVPIIKCRTKQGIDLDVAISDRAACEAAKWQSGMSKKWPPLKPLVIVLKAFLKWHNLGDVSTGGLGSFSIVNMVLGFLLTSKQDDFGSLFVGFLRFYSKEFDYKRDAVSVNRGGIVTKASVLHNGCNNDLISINSPGEEKLTVEDPLTGRDVAGGSYMIYQVKSAFLSALQKLESISARGFEAWDGQSLLGAIMDVDIIIRRPGYACQWRNQGSAVAENSSETAGKKRSLNGTGGNPNSKAARIQHGLDACKSGKPTNSNRDTAFVASGSRAFVDQLIFHTKREAEKYRQNN